MELYHIHLLGNHDRLYEENSEFEVDKNKFNNRIYDRIYNMNSTVSVRKYSNMVDYLNYLLKMHGMGIFNDRINLGEIIELVLHEGASVGEIRDILEDAKKIILDEGINLREMAMEEYRKENCNNIPSRMHSLFACSGEGLPFWIEQINDGEVNVFRIDVFDEPFISNEVLLPSETLSYGDKINASYKYFHPNEQDLNTLTNEYLVQGKVKVLERVM